mmetsp:Transcript_85/g.202  ORF Transcript_85/g.202 Transcript_85/m.202 type:complete len:303 (-) Transcript_85:187-1095(-)
MTRRMMSTIRHFYQLSPLHRSTPTNPMKKKRKPAGPLPYKCGVVFFYHIPSTGGASINMWLKKYSSPKLYNFAYFQHWKSDFHSGQARDVSHALESEKNFTLGMDKHVEGLEADEWRLAHCHINSMYLNETEYLLQKWRSTVESQGCHMINTIMLRDPLSHALSLHKVIKRKRSNIEEWAAFLKNPAERGLWATNLDFLLYNKARRNPHNAKKEEKVRRAMEILQRNFDVVTVGDHDKFMNSVLEMTGWNRIEMPHANTFKGELNFTKKQVENLQKLLRGNGDLDFMDAVRVRYNGYLDYLE